MLGPGPVHVSCIACIVGVARKNLTPKSKVTNERFGTSSHPLQNGMLTHPQDFDAPLRLAAQGKINNYRQ